MPVVAPEKLVQLQQQSEGIRNVGNDKIHFGRRADYTAANEL